MKYKQKPIIIEAKKFPDNGPEQIEILNWVEKGKGVLHVYDIELEKNIKHPTGATWRWKNGYLWSQKKNPAKSSIVNIGDWIIKGITGEFTCCNPDIFDAIYEKIEVSQ